MISELDKKWEDLLLRGIFDRTELIASVATHAALDSLDRSPTSPYSTFHYEKQAANLAAQISLQLATGVGNVFNSPSMPMDEGQPRIVDVKTADYL